MTIFQSRQSDWRRRVGKKANANTLQISVTNCPTKLHGHVHEGRKIQRNNVSSVVQKHGCKYCFYAKQALPLIFIRLSRLANSLPTIRRSPARRSRDDREPSGKVSGDMSRVSAVQRPGKGRAVSTAMRRGSVETAHKITCRKRNLAAQCQRRKPARHLGTQLRNSLPQSAQGSKRHFTNGF